MNPQEPVSTPVPNIPVQKQGSYTQKIDSPMDLLKSGLELLSGHWRTLAPIMLLPTIIMDLVTLIGYNKSGPVFLISLIVLIITIVISVASVPALVNAISKVSADPTVKISFKEQYKLGFSYFWSYILVAIIGLFVGLGSVFLLIVPGIIVALYTSFYSYALIVDGKKGLSAFTESYSLVRGRWWPVLGRMLFLVMMMLIVGLIVSGINFLVNLIFGIPVTVVGSSQAQIPIGASIVSMIISLVINTIIGLVSMGYTYGMYISLKSTRDQNISTTVFKRWIITFICIGIVGIILILIAAPILFLGSAGSKIIQSNQDIKSRMIEIQKQIDSESLKNASTSSTNN